MTSGRGPVRYQGDCKVCGDAIYKTKSNAVFCSDRCRRINHDGGKCVDCGKPTVGGGGGTAERCSTCRQRWQDTHRLEHSQALHAGQVGRGRWNRNTVAEAMRHFAAEIGDPTKRQIDAHSASLDWMPSLPMILRVYGTLSAARTAIGLSVNSIPKGMGAQKYSDADCLNAIRSLAAELNRLPTNREYEEWDGRNGHPSTCTIRNRFGNWTDALERAAA